VKIKQHCIISNTVFLYRHRRKIVNTYGNPGIRKGCQDFWKELRVRPQCLQTPDSIIQNCLGSGSGLQPRLITYCVFFQVPYFMIRSFVGIFEEAVTTITSVTHSLIHLRSFA